MKLRLGFCKVHIHLFPSTNTTCGQYLPSFLQKCVRVSTWTFFFTGCIGFEPLFSRRFKRYGMQPDIIPLRESLGSEETEPVLDDLDMFSAFRF